MKNLQLLFQRDAMAELVAIFSFLTAGDAIHLVSAQKDIWVRWYNRENDEKSEKKYLTGKEIVWSALLTRDFERTQNDFLSAANEVGHHKQSNPLKSYRALRRCLFLRNGKSFKNTFKEKIPAFRNTLHLLYKFMASNSISTPFCTLYKMQTYDYDYSEVLHIDKAQKSVDELATPDSDGGQFMLRYDKLLRFLVSRINLTGGVLAELRIDPTASESSGINVDVWSAIGHKIDLSLFGDTNDVRHGQEKAPEHYSRLEKMRLQSALKLLHYSTHPKNMEKSKSSPDVSSHNQWCRLLLDSEGRLCSVDVATQELIPVTFESSGTFIVHMRSIRGGIIPFFRLSPLNANDYHSSSIHDEYYQHDLLSMISDRNVHGTVDANEVFRQSEICTVRRNPYLKPLKRDYVLRQLPDSFIISDAKQRCDEALPNLLYYSSTGRCKNTLCDHEAKQIYFRECMRNLYPLFMQYDDSHSAGLFMGCYATHGNELIRLHLEPFTTLAGETVSNSDDSGITSRNYINPRWEYMEDKTLPSPRYYINTDTSHIAEESTNSKNTFGLQLQGVKVSGDPNVPGGMLSFCFNALEVLPSHYNSIIGPDGPDSDDATAPHLNPEEAFFGTQELNTSKEDIIDGYIPPLLQSMLSSYSEPENQAQERVKANFAQCELNMRRAMESKIHNMFLQQTNHGTTRMHDTWIFNDRIQAELALTSEALGRSVRARPESFPLDRTRHILYILDGRALINVVQGAWNPEWTKGSMIVYDKVVYEQSGVVFSIVFGNRGEEEEDVSSFYIDFKPFKRVNYDE